MEIKPFQGIRYNPDKVGDISQVVAPPYDKITPSLQETLYQRHQNNVVRLILGKINKDDNEENNRYTRAAEYLQSWMENEILVRDKDPSLYLYEQVFTAPEHGKKVRRGIICAVKLMEPGKGIHPHERTLSGPKEDRLKLMRATNANFGQIFSLFKDEPGNSLKLIEEITKEAPLSDFYFDDGIQNRLWVISDEQKISMFQEVVKESELFIADGHHRYETALNYAMERREQLGDSYSGDEPFDYVMMTLVNMDDPGLVILPTHRAVKKIKRFNKDRFIRDLDRFFYIQKLDLPYDLVLKKMAQLGEKQKVFAMYMGSDKLYLLTLKDSTPLEELMPDVSDLYRNLDVALLHGLIIEGILKIDRDLKEEGQSIAFYREAKEALNEVAEGRYQVCFLLNPTRIEQVQQIASMGEKMPQKSTDFYPKLLSGLVLRSLD